MQPTGGGVAMTFEELLAQILEVLQREWRVSYRALKPDTPAASRPSR